MAIRTVRLDEETEAALREVRKLTGLPISEVLKQGVHALRERAKSQQRPTPYEIYKSLTVGPGGWAIDSSDQIRRGLTQALKKKLKR